MKEIKIKENTFRIKKMNAIELLALQTQIDFENMEATTKCYNILLEHLEVHLEDEKWLPVKEKNKDIYYPNEIENDLNSIQILIKFILDYIKEVFQKSDVLN